MSVTLQTTLIRLALAAHLTAQFYFVFYLWQFPLAEGVFQFAQLAIMALLCYTSFYRHQRDPVNVQKKLVFYALVIWLLRYYVNLVSYIAADMMSLAVIWLFVRSQTAVLSLQRRSQQIIDLSFIAIESLLLIIGLADQAQPMVLLHRVYTMLFTGSHLCYIMLIFLMYARAVVITKDPTIKVRFAFLMLAATLYIGLFLSDFVWRSLAPGSMGNLPSLLKDVFGIFGIFCLYVAFNMSDNARRAIILWHHIYRGQTQQRLISLVLHISEAVSGEEDHILPTLTTRVANRLALTDQQRRIAQQAAVILAIVHRHELPNLRRQWHAPTPMEKNMAGSAIISPQSLFEDRLMELNQVHEALQALDLPYVVSRESSPIETEILRVVYAYLAGADLPAIIAAKGVDYAPQVVDALVAEVTDQINLTG